MRLAKAAILAAGVAAAAVTTTPASAASEQAECRKTVRAALIAASEEGTYGDFMSDTIFGNEPNIEGPFAPGGPSEQEPGTKGGRVVPSLTPGPASTTGGFYTGGDLQSDIRAACADQTP